MPIVEHMESSFSSFKQGASELVTQIGGDIRTPSIHSMQGVDDVKIFEIQFVMNGEIITIDVNENVDAWDLSRQTQDKYNLNSKATA